MIAIRSTARLSDYLFRHAFPVYAQVYERYKRVAERDAIACIQRVLVPGDRAIDVGANIGFYAAALAEQVGPHGAVWAFEPAPLNFARLAARARRYPQLHVMQACVAAEAGTAELFLSPDLNIDHRSYATAEPRERVPVVAVAVDGVVPAGESVQFAKLDIQGAEYDALRGMRAVLARSPRVTLLLELWPAVQDRIGPGTRGLLELLETYGFAVHRLAAGGVPGERLDPSRPIPGRDDDRIFFDVICVRRDAATAPG